MLARVYAVVPSAGADSVVSLNGSSQAFSDPTPAVVVNVVTDPDVEKVPEPW